MLIGICDFGVRAENLFLLSEQVVFWKFAYFHLILVLASEQKIIMCAKACLRVDLESVLDHFEFKMYQSKRKINFAMYQSKKNNFTMLSEKILQCIRAS